MAGLVRKFEPIIRQRMLDSQADATQKKKKRAALEIAEQVAPNFFTQGQTKPMTQPEGNNVMVAAKTGIAQPNLQTPEEIEREKRKRKATKIATLVSPGFYSDQILG